VEESLVSLLNGKRIKMFGLLLAVLAGFSNAFAQDTATPPLGEPRIDRVQKPWTAAEAAILAPRERDGSVLGVWSTCANAPALCNAWLEFTDYLLQDSSLPIRDRELLIMRIGYLNHGAYEWAAHRGLSLRVGISEAQLVQLAVGSSHPDWNEWDATLLRAAEELHENALLSDATWSALAARYDKRQMMETVFTVGQYNMVAMYLNSLGVQFEEGWIGPPIVD